MKKGCIAAIIIALILLCCCVSSGIVFGLFGNFTINGECVWIGPLSRDLNSECSAKRAAEKSNKAENDSSLLDILEKENTDPQVEEEAKTNSANLTFSNSNLSFQYPNNESYSLEDSSVSNKLDLTISVESSLSDVVQTLRLTEIGTAFEVNNANCKVYMDSFIEAVESTYLSSLSNQTYTVSRVDGISACKINYDREDSTSNLRYSQTLYTIPVEGFSYNFISIYKAEDLVKEVFEEIVSSVKFN